MKMLTFSSFLLAISCLHTASVTSTPPRFIIANAMARNVIPGYCMDYFESQAAKIEFENINREMMFNALNSEKDWNEQEEYSMFQNQVLEVAKTPGHNCNASIFAPSILKANYKYTCREICKACMPGSVPICYLRSEQYKNMAEVCLCTYDIEKPLKNAALSLRHEKRVFDRPSNSSQI